MMRISIYSLLLSAIILFDIDALLGTISFSAWFCRKIPKSGGQTDTPRLTYLLFPVLYSYTESSADVRRWQEFLICIQRMLTTVASIVDFWFTHLGLTQSCANHRNFNRLRRRQKENHLHCCNRGCIFCCGTSRESNQLTQGIFSPLLYQLSYGTIRDKRSISYYRGAKVSKKFNTANALCNFVGKFFPAWQKNYRPGNQKKVRCPNGQRT